MESSFEIGKYRPIYLWGGPGTIRMNQIKFMNYPVNQAVHRGAHAMPAAGLVVNDLNCNWVHLMYDWGFPPEIEEEDWEDFRRAADVYHQAGSPVFAYIQTSNCVFDGSFSTKDWYAKDPRGRKIYYYSGRYMVDWTHPEWLQHLKALIQGAIERGADGIFFDNMWYGQGPSGLMGAWLGGAGCYCDRCQSLYHAATGKSIPEKILPGREDVAEYLRWRASRVTETIQELADTVHSLKPDAPISANDYDVTMRNAYLIHGIDMEALAKIQDVIMVENFALPHWDAEPSPRLANNALTIRNTREFVRDQAHLNVLSYDAGIGFDPVYPPRRHQQGIAEAAACGASMTIKGTEYNDGQCMTLLTDSAYHAQHQAIGAYHRWLEDHQDLYQGQENAAKIALLHPGEDLWRDWMILAPVYYAASQVLTVAGIPWQVVREDHLDVGLTALLTFTEPQRNIRLPDAQVRQIHVPDLDGWAWKKQSVVARGGVWHTLVEKIGLFLLRAYHASKLARKVMDALNLSHFVLKTSLFDLPSQSSIKNLIAALPTDIYPRVRALQPVLIECWQKDQHQQIHLMNYADHPQEISVQFDSTVTARMLSPDQQAPMILKGNTLTFILDVYAILILE